MTPKELKNSILQLAIEGKLVEQIKDEGSAENLYAEIQKEKQKLIKQGKIKKEKELPEITDDEIPFEIPKSWKWVRLGNIITELGDGLHGTPKYDLNGSYYFINGNNLKEKQIIIKNDTKKVNEIEYRKYKKQLNDKTILVSINGTLGNIAYYNNEKIILGKSACYFNLVYKEFKDFIYNIIDSKYFIDYANVNATGTTIKNVSLLSMKMLLIPLPPLAEQKRIVEKIEELMPLIDRYEVLYNRLKELNKEFPKKLKNAVLQKAIEGNLVPQIKSEGSADDLYKEIQKEKQKLIKQEKIKKEKELPEITDDEIPFEIPKSWKWCRINECFDMYTGNSISENIKQTKYIKLSKGYNYIGTKDVSFEQEINYDNGVKIPYNEEGFKKAEKGSVLMCIEGGSAGRKIAVTNEKVCFGNKLCKFNQFSGNNKYIFYYLQSPQFLEQFKENLTGIIGGVSIQKIKEIVFPLPPLAEQKRIVEKIEKILPNIEKLEKYN